MARPEHTSLLGWRRKSDLSGDNAKLLVGWSRDVSPEHLPKPQDLLFCCSCMEETATQSADLGEHPIRQSLGRSNILGLMNSGFHLTYIECNVQEVKFHSTGKSLAILTQLKIAHTACFKLHGLVCENIGNIANFGKFFELYLWETICNLLSYFIFFFP